MPDHMTAVTQQRRRYSYHGMIFTCCSASSSSIADIALIWSDDQRNVAADDGEGLDKLLLTMFDLKLTAWQWGSQILHAIRIL